MSPAVPSDLGRNQIVLGEAKEVLARLPADSVDCLVTSPPYWQQRDYGCHPQQIGREPTAAQYVENLREVFRHAKRVLKPEGTAWIVLGDKYREGKLLGLPWRVVLALVEDGWVLRADCIWHKPNAMPSSVKTRPTVDHEYIFLLARSAAHYYDADAIREPHVTFTPHSRMRGGRRHFGIRGGTPERGKNAGNSNLHHGRWDQAFHPQGRNKRTVWSIPLSKFREAHFAVFPEALVETCILAGSPPGGLVLDPFAGSGTVCVVACRLGRDYLGIDCVPEYCQMARRRLAQTARPLPGVALAPDAVRSVLPAGRSGLKASRSGQGEQAN
jgi:site-specific DNA-methyltransferase (adenine-specific)